MMRGWLVPIALFLFAAILSAPVWPYNHDGLVHITAWMVPLACSMVVAGIIIVAILEHR